MKIVLNIEKRHLILFSLFLVLVGSVFVIGTATYNQQGTPLSGVGHTELYVSNIYSWLKDQPIKIFDPKGPYLGLGSLNGPTNRFDFFVDSENQIEFYGKTGPDYKFDTFRVKANKIELRGDLCSSPTNCIPVEELIDKINRLEGCTLNSKRCTDSTHYQQCNAQGNWNTPVACLSNQRCENGNCITGCVAGSTECITGTNNYHTCKTDGTWNPPQACTGEQICSEGNCINQLHVTGDTAISNQNTYLKSADRTNQELVCNGIVFGFKNNNLDNTRLDDMWCDPDISQTIMNNKVTQNTKLVESGENGGNLLCNNDEIVCGVVTNNDANSKLKKIICCEINDYITDLFNKRVVDSAANSGNLFCNVNEVVCGGKYKNRVHDQLDMIYCCSIQEST